MSSVEILGVRLDLVSPAELKSWLDAALGEPWNGCCRHVVTLNPEYVMAARRDPGFAAALHDADLSTADGVGVVAAARIVHGRSVNRITGVDFVELLAASSAPLYLLGAGPGIADMAADALKERFPGTRIAGTWSDGAADPIHDEPAMRRVAESQAKVVAVAYGAPNQVIWIQRNQAALAAAGVRVVIGVGGAFDYLAGAAKRPPSIVRRVGLEWLFRLVREPRRWRRQLVLPVFAVLMLRDAARARIRRLRKRSR